MTEGSDGKDVSPLDPSELPSDLVARSAVPVLYGYRYIKVPYGASLQVKRHEDLALKRSIIDRADVTSFTALDGKLLTKVCWQVRNNGKQFLRVSLPAGATVWSTFLEDKPVKAAKDDKGDLLIPLHRPAAGDDGARPFAVELVYYQDHAPFHLLGRKHQVVPATDLECLEMAMTIYVPAKYAVYGFGGELEPGARPRLSGGTLAATLTPETNAEETEATTGGAPARHRRSENEKRDEDLSRSDAIESLGDVASSETPAAAGPIGGENGPVQAPQAQVLRGGYNVAAQKAGSARGVLPVRIAIPTEGQSFTFGKTVVKAGEQPALSYWYLTQKARQPLDELLVVIAALFTILALAALGSAAPLSPRRVATLAILLLAMAAIRFLAMGRPGSIVLGALVPLVLYIAYLVLRRGPERLEV